MSVSDVSISNISSVDYVTTISASDLDEMFVRNLKMLKDFEDSELSSVSSNQSSKRYQSSINIYISPRTAARFSDGVCYSSCNIDPVRKMSNHTDNGLTDPLPRTFSNKLTKTFSSYETLYDKLQSDLIKTNNHSDLETTNERIKEKTSHSLNDILKVDRDSSSDSDKTLKSLSSGEVSSSVSSLESQSDFLDIVFPNLQNRLSQQLEDSLPKLRPMKNDNNNRPISCYVDTKFGRYSPKRNFSRSDMISRESYDKSNFIISKPLGSYPSRLSNSFVSINDGVINNYNQRSSRVSFLESSYEPLLPVCLEKNFPICNRNRSSSNILNNNNNIVKNNGNDKCDSSKSSSNISSPVPSKHMQIEFKATYKNNNNTKPLPIKQQPKRKNIFRNPFVKRIDQDSTII